MFGGFDPSGLEGAFLQRRRWQSLLAALLLVGGGLASAFHVASLEQARPSEEQWVEVEVQDLELEVELEDEPEPPPEPPAPAPLPSSEPVERPRKPTPQPTIQNPDAVDEAPVERPVDSSGPGYHDGGGSNEQRGRGGPKPAREPAPKPELKPKPKPKPKFAYDPDKPIERPPEATVPKQVGGNPPVYPAALRSRNVTGKVKVRLTIYKDGSVKGAKVLAKDNSVDADEDPELHARANKLLLEAVAAAVRTWKFKPSTVNGQAISVYLTVTIPFTLK